MRVMRVRIVLSRGQELLREHLVEGAITFVGRDPACDIAVDDITVSKRHMKLEIVDDTVHVEDLASMNGVRVNGVAVKRQILRHLDVVEFGGHKIHVFDNELLPEGALTAETTVTSSAVPAGSLAETQPGNLERPAMPPMFGLRQIFERGGGGIAPLDQLRTMVGPAGKSALLVRRRDKLYLTRLSRVPLLVNGQEVDTTSCAVEPGDVIEVGAAKYELVCLAATA
jgi:pSer/pThr/pTyr-binding forkhead associated (FHA) protein